MKPKVSIVVVVYNHAPYLRECLDGALSQKVDFPIEIVAHDDASPDGSADIIRSYAGRLPDVFVPILQTDNQYSKGHEAIISRFCMPHVSGEYIAIVEGDDYWCDTDKLRRQVEYLDKHPQVGMVYGRCRAWNQDKQCFGGEFGGPYTEFEDLFFQSTIPTATVMVRKELMTRYYEEVKPDGRGWAMGDYPMWLWFALNSKIAFQPEITAVYRVLAESASHSRSLARRYQFRLNSNPVSEYFIEHYGDRFTPEFIHRNRSQRHEMTLPMAIQMKDWATVDKIREYYAKAAAQGHATPSAMARMLAHPRLSRHLINMKIVASNLKSLLLKR